VPGKTFAATHNPSFAPRRLRPSSAAGPGDPGGAIILNAEAVK